MTKCPYVPEFEPVDRSGGVTALPTLARARREAPVFYMPEQEMWALTRHEDVAEVLRDWKRFSTEPYMADVEVPEEILAMMGSDYRGPITPDQLLPVGPPDHTRKRRAFQPAFSPKNIEAQRSRIAAYADELIDSFIAEGRADLVQRFAGPFVVGVISDWLGLPPEWRGRFRDYTAANVRRLGVAAVEAPEQERVADWRILAEFDRMFAEYVAERRAAPTDDLTSQFLLATDDDGEPLLNDAEVQAGVVSFATAGSDTSANVICHAVQLLLTHSEQWQALREDRSRIPAAVEEVLRYRGGLTGGLFRKALCDVEVGGVAIPAGSILYLLIGSANRDTAAFAAPDEFDIEREDAGRHVGFGRGIHLCIGAPLARLEAEVALDRFLDRLPDLRLVDPGAVLDYSPSLLLGKLQHLEVAW